MILIVLAVIIIPVIANFYLSAWSMKLDGDEDITVGDVINDLGEAMFCALIPIGSILFMFYLIVGVMCKLLKDFKLL